MKTNLIVTNSSRSIEKGFDWFGSRRMHLFEMSMVTLVRASDRFRYSNWNSVQPPNGASIDGGACSTGSSA